MELKELDNKLGVRDILAIVRERDEYLARLYDQKKVKELELDELEKAIRFLEKDSRGLKPKKPVIIAPASKGNKWEPLQGTVDEILRLFAGKSGKADIRRCEIKHAIHRTDHGRMGEYRTADWYVQKYLDWLIDQNLIEQVRRGYYVRVYGTIEELF